jgi:two-component system sensor histidine kinase NblS
MIYYFVNFIFFKKIKFDLKYFNKTKVFVSELSTTLIENFLDGIILLNLDLEVIYINEQALKFLNWKFREICEINFLENFDSEFNKQFLEEIEKLILKINSHEEKKYKEIIISLNKYSEKIILIIIKIIVKKKKIIGIVLIIKNISKKITLNKRKLLFLSNISHELRTPLFNIQSFINVHDFNNTDEVIEYVMRLDSDEDLYNRVISAPPLASGIPRDYMILNNFLNWFDSVVYNKIDMIE